MSRRSEIIERIIAELEGVPSFATLTNLARDLNRIDSTLSQEEKNKLNALQLRLFSAGIGIQIAIPKGVDLTAGLDNGSNRDRLSYEFQSVIDSEQPAKSGRVTFEQPIHSQELNQELADTFENSWNLMISTIEELKLNSKKYFLFRTIGSDNKSNQVFIASSGNPNLAQKIITEYTRQAKCSSVSSMVMIDSKEKPNISDWESMNIAGVFLSNLSRPAENDLDFLRLIQKIHKIKIAIYIIEAGKAIEIYTNSKVQEYLAHKSKAIFEDHDLSLIEEVQIRELLSFDTVQSIGYQKLNAGFTGAKVLLVSMVKNNKSAPLRVVKLHTKNPKKLEEEKFRFERFLKDTENNILKLSSVSIGGSLALMYEYASSDGKKPSISFNEFLRLCSTHGEIYEKKKFINVSQKILNNQVLASIEDTICYRPSSSFSSDDSNFDLFEFINRRVKLEVVALKCSRINLGQDDYLNQFETKQKALELLKTIILTRTKIHTKICHGDLHIDNIHLDESIVQSVLHNNSNDWNSFIIDYGELDESIVFYDHAFLETSIKLRAIPQYVGWQAELHGFEMSLDAQEEDPNIKDDLKPFYWLILQIRREAINLMKSDAELQDSLDQYRLALLISTLRHLGFSNVNDRYAAYLLSYLVKQYLPDCGVDKIDIVRDENSSMLKLPQHTEGRT